MHPSRARRLGALLFLSLLVALAIPTGVAAHAELVETIPEADATIEGTPGEVSAAFSERLTSASRLVLRDAGGTTIATGARDAEDRARLVLEPPELEPGTYEVRWTAGSADGHTERGTWRFTVTAPPTPEPTPEPTPVPTTDATAVPSPTPAATPEPTREPTPAPTADPGDPAGADGDVLLPIVGAVVLLAVLGIFLFGRRGRSTPAA